MAQPKVSNDFDAVPDVASESRADAAAEADFTAGRVVPNAEVRKWLESWGKPHELPCPAPKTR